MFKMSTVGPTLKRFWFNRGLHAAQASTHNKSLMWKFLAVQWLELVTFIARVQVQSLVGELKSCKAHGPLTKKKKRKKNQPDSGSAVAAPWTTSGGKLGELHQLVFGLLIR